MIEIWKDVIYDGVIYEGYQVSNLGRVKSLKFGKERVLRQIKNTDCYLKVNIYKNGKVETFLVHRLVASAFLENSENKPEVNHKDEVKTNNFVFVNEDGTVDYDKSNLEWCTHVYNVRYSIEKIRQNHHRTKVLMIDKVSNEVVKTYQMMKDVEKDGMKKQCVSRAIRGVRKTYRGYIWKKCD